MKRHDHFNRALQRLKAHLVISLGFADTNDRLGKAINSEWFAEHLYEADARFKDVEVTGIVVTTKEDYTAFKIIGQIETPSKQMSPLQSPPISLIKLQGEDVYNYPFLDLAKEHLNTVILEAEEFLKYKSASNQLRMAV